MHASYAWLMCMQLSVFGCTDFDIVVPVPLSKERLYERGFNQAELLAKDIAKQFHMPCVTNALKKRKNTKRQSELSMEQRNRNVRDAFVLDRADAIYKKHVLLIDDIFTTGATVREASAVLSCAAETITVCTVAKTMMK